MKVYLKILSIAVATQVIGFIVTYFLDFLLQKIEQSTVPPIIVGVIFVVLSMVLALVLAIRWCKSKRVAFITYVLLPTNYTWLVLASFVIRFVKNILNILDSIPPNFG